MNAHAHTLHVPPAAQHLADSGWFVWLRTGTEFADVPELSAEVLRHTFCVVRLPCGSLVIVDPVRAD